MTDRGVDLADGLVELLARRGVVLGEAGLEVLHLTLEVRDVDVLLAHGHELLLVRERAQGRVAQQGDHGDEELRTDDVHLGVAVAHVHDALVVELALRLEQRDQHRILAALGGAVVVELLEEVLVLVLGRRGVVLVLHLEHDGDDLGAVALLAEDEVALAALARVVVLLKVRIGERRHTQAVELRLAVLLERLAHHLGGKANLHVAQAFDLLVLVADELVARLLGLLELEGVARRGLLLARRAHGDLLRELGARLVALVLGGGHGAHAGGLRGALLLAQLEA